jgi:tetratricopeptide (TPR) repeat protein/transcriptional regulator with XRE-family HTH domain
VADIDAGDARAGAVEGLRSDGVAFGQWVRRQRNSALMTQEDLAERAGVSVRTIQTLESGQTARPRPATRRLLTTALAAPARTVRTEIPRQLPAAMPAFAGRRAQIDHLDGVLLGRGAEPGGAAGVVVVSGPAGVGKTVLATHWAHLASAFFPDGQLHVTMRGFDPAASPTPPGDAIRVFLDGLGVGPDRMPAGLDAQIALFRSVVAGKRVLIVIDNVRDAEQVRPLLPGDRTCAVVVTSRDRLIGLAATHGAHQLPLDLPSVSEARELLAGRLGAERVASVPYAVTEIIERCARLPLALGVVAARVAADPGFSLSAVAAELRDAGLGALSGGEPASDVRSVFSWSYRALSAPARRLFRLLGLHPGPEMSAQAAAGLAGAPLDEVRAWLSELTRVHLLTETAPGRYAFHDLLRAYAVERAEAEQPAADRAAAVDRMLDYYLLTARHAESLRNPARPPDRPGGSSPASPVEPAALADHHAALAWFKTEHQVLLSVHRRAAELGLDRQVCQLALAVAGFLQRYGLWQDQVTVLTAGKAAGGLLRTSDLIVLLGYLGQAYTQLGRFADALVELGHAFDLAGDIGDQGRLAQVHQSLAVVLDRQDRHAEALHHAEQVYAITEGLDDPRRQASALGLRGWYRARAGDYERAVADCRAALLAYERQGDRAHQASGLHSLGYAHHQRGEHHEALACYRRSIALCQEFGERFSEAKVLADAGNSYWAMGEIEVARGTWQAAFDILRDLGHPDAESVRERIDGIRARGGG